MDLGGVGIWTIHLDAQPIGCAREAVVELDELGFGALWIPETIGREPFATSAMLLSSTSRLVIATGIASLHARTALTMATGWKTLTEAFPERFLLGVGVSHQVAVETFHASRYERPYPTMVAYLDAMDQAPYAGVEPSTEPRRVLAALGPRMLGLAGDRALGAHPYFTTVEHTAFAREQLGPDGLLAPEMMAVLDTDPHSARAIARAATGRYLELPNYANNLRRLGWDDRELADGGSDRLIDAIVARGSVDDVAARVRHHHDAGADHVCIQLLTADRAELPIEGWRRLADALL